MAPKPAKKAGGKSAEDTALDAANLVDDIDNPEVKKGYRIEIRQLNKFI